jgi:hypothetical protein
MKPGQDWLLLLYASPARKGTSRVSLWRQLKKSGAVALKNSSYILPDEPQQHVEHDRCLLPIAGALHCAILHVVETKSLPLLLSAGSGATDGRLPRSHPKSSSSR